MEDLVDDPLVLEAALALADEWYAEAETESDENAATSVSVASMPSRDLRRQAHEELLWLRCSVQQLQKSTMTSQPRLHPHAISAPSDEDSEVESGAESSTPDQRDAQARRLLQAIQTYNRVRASTRLTFGCGGRHTISPMDDERIIATLRSRLDALAEIVQANRTTRMPMTGADIVPVMTERGFQYQARASYVLPFKLSNVEDVLWQMTVETTHEGQLCIAKPNELFTKMESSRETPWGVISTCGSNALRRIYQADGSVVHLYTLVHSAPLNRGSHSDSALASLVAGCVVKHAGWTRVRRAPAYNGVRADRQLVWVEVSQGLVVEALPGYSISRDRVHRIRNAVFDPSNLRSGSRTTLENRLLDHKLRREREKKL